LTLAHAREHRGSAAHQQAPYTALRPRYPPVTCIYYGIARVSSPLCASCLTAVTRVATEFNQHPYPVGDHAVVKMRLLERLPNGDLKLTLFNTDAPPGALTERRLEADFVQY